MLATLVASCGEAEAGRPPPAVTVAEPIKRTVFDFDEYVGRFVAVSSVEVRARVWLSRRLPLQRRPTRQAGRLLFTIDKRPFQNTVEQGWANLVQANPTSRLRSRLPRGQQLVKDKTITDQTFDSEAKRFVTPRLQ